MFDSYLSTFKKFYRAKAAKEKYSFSELGVLCVFARVYALLE
jgi:hypothetical protein